MRLFIAINFDEKVRQFLGAHQKKIQTLCPQGKFTRYQNMHLTLIFLGETPQEDLPAIITSMEEIQTRPFWLTFDAVGRFKRKDGDIYWMGTRVNQTLHKLRRQLYERLTQIGFNLDSRPFNAHITLARAIKLSCEDDYETLKVVTNPLEVSVDCISLMESTHLKGILTYREVYGKKLSP
ncbi:MAG: RNA 2',3'-cyclic phosphodiesterase [Sphaerochaetaceae bacterium]|jgi:2'-5' RNA ligase|nr:RNA 2',3'-cyclic phosphodiesterase [Sphaerochaetaceae bacterium]MDY0370819.1 RNA 2',3'-cyclic phosphodiesterase [Sphaerochaetaceae bacterium]